MLDNLDRVLHDRYAPRARPGLANDIIHKTKLENDARPVAFFMLRPRYAYAVVGMFIIGVIALLASFPNTPTRSDDGAFGEISTFMVYDTLSDFSDVS